MTWVSSECNKFVSLQVPLPRAANTRARLERLFEPGVAMRTGLFVGTPGTTLAASARVLPITGSGTTLAFCSTVLPMVARSTIFFSGPLFFLSIRIMSSRRPTVRSLEAGRPAIRVSDNETGKL
jgi:hypothetical protein